MTTPRPLFRAHDATFCCRGSLGWASTYRVRENPDINTKKEMTTAQDLKNLRRVMNQSLEHGYDELLLSLR